MPTSKRRADRREWEPTHYICDDCNIVAHISALKNGCPNCGQTMVPYTPEQPASLPSPLAKAVALLPNAKSNDHPVWQGPCGNGWNGGVTQSMIARFLSCRERFRLRYVLGLEPHDRWNRTTGYGSMWHVCEEALANCDGPCPMPSTFLNALWSHTDRMLTQYPLQREEILKWANVCAIQFPEYVKFWETHPDVINRTPLFQEQLFDVPYELPSGRVVRLRGRWDSVDLIDGGVWLQENKTKGDIDRSQVERQLKFDLQTMLYLVALEQTWKGDCPMNALGTRICGVRYNVVRRPLSGGKGSITPHKATLGTKCPKCKGDGRAATLTSVCIAKGNLMDGFCSKCHGKGRIGAKPAETEEAFYERLQRDYIAKEPDYWFFRVRAEVSQDEIDLFRRTCLDPILEQMCWWYDTVTDSRNIPASDEWLMRSLNHRTPFGVWSALEEGGSTEYDAYLETGNEAGLRRVNELFTELKL